MLGTLLCCKEAVAIHVPWSQRKISSIDLSGVFVESRMDAGSCYIFEIRSVKPINKSGISPYIIECWPISNISYDGDLNDFAISSAALEFVHILVFYEDCGKDRNGLSGENSV